MDALGLIAVVVVVWGWIVFDALRNRRRFEALGCVLLAGVIVGVFLAAKAGQPRWVSNVLVGLGFLISAPLTWANFRRRWQTLKDTLPSSRS
jgi:sugar phosphate permease